MNKRTALEYVSLNKNILVCSYFKYEAADDIFFMMPIDFQPGICFSRKSTGSCDLEISSFFWNLESDIDHVS